MFFRMLFIIQITITIIIVRDKRPHHRPTFKDVFKPINYRALKNPHENNSLLYWNLRSIGNRIRTNGYNTFIGFSVERIST